MLFGIFVLCTMRRLRKYLLWDICSRRYSCLTVTASTHISFSSVSCYLSLIIDSRVCSLWPVALHLGDVFCYLESCMVSPWSSVLALSVPIFTISDLQSSCPNSIVWIFFIVMQIRWDCARLEATVSEDSGLSIVLNWLTDTMNKSSPIIFVWLFIFEIWHRWFTSLVTSSLIHTLRNPLPRLTYVIDVASS